MSTVAGRDDLCFFVAIITLVGSIVESSILFDVEAAADGGGHFDVVIIVGYVGREGYGPAWPALIIVRCHDEVVGCRLL